MPEIWPTSHTNIIIVFSVVRSQSEEEARWVDGWVFITTIRRSLDADWWMWMVVWSLLPRKWCTLIGDDRRAVIRRVCVFIVGLDVGLQFSCCVEGYLIRPCSCPPPPPGSGGLLKLHCIEGAADDMQMRRSVVCYSKKVKY